MQSKVLIMGFTTSLVGAIMYTNIYLPQYSKFAQERRAQIASSGNSPKKVSTGNNSMWSVFNNEDSKQKP